MKIKKILIAILMTMVILSLGASYIFSGYTPAVVPEPIVREEPAPPTGFTGPTGTPSVKGPTAPLPGGSQ